MSFTPPSFNPNDIESYIYQQIDTLGNLIGGALNPPSGSGTFAVSSSYASSSGHAVTASNAQTITGHVFCMEGSAGTVG